VWEWTLDIIGIILKVISMAEKIITEVGNNNEGSITIILTIEEFEIFRDACLNLLDYYEMARGRSRKIKKILEKLEEAKK
jgi:hypothetical protein